MTIISSYQMLKNSKEIARIIIKRFEMAGILVNKRKCKIIPLTKPFRFCKARFTLTETGKIKAQRVQRRCKTGA